MSDVIRTAGIAGTFPYRLRDASGGLVTPLTSPVGSIHATLADAQAGAAPLSGPATLAGAAGDYTATYPAVLAAGTYFLRFVTQLTASSTYIDTNDRLLLQTTSGDVGDSLVTLAQLKQQLNIPSDSTVHDAELAVYAAAVTAPVEHYIGPVLPATVTEWHTPPGSRLAVRAERISAVVSVTEYDGNLATTVTEVATPALAGADTFMRDPSVGNLLVRLDSGGIEQQWSERVQVVVSAGMTVIPDAINLAARIIAQHLWETQNGGVGLPSLTGEELVPLPGSGFLVPQRARELLDLYRRSQGIA